MELVSWAAVAVIVMSFGLAIAKRVPAAGSLMLANVFVFAMSSFGPQMSAGRSVIQNDLALHGDWLANGDAIAYLQLVTSMFVHADFFHLVGNLIILFAFAFPFEERIGPVKFLGAYFGAGLLGTVAQVASSWGDPILLMGASGAVFGIIGAFAGAFPRLVLPLPLPLFIIMIFVRMRVIMAAAIFAAMQFILLFTVSRYDNTAYWAHLGGLAAGLALSPLFRPGKTAAPKEVQAKISLEAYATNPAAKNALVKMEASADLPDIYWAWAEKFVVHAETEEGKRLEIRNRQFVELRS